MGILSCNIQLRHQRSRIVSFQGRKAQLYKSCILSPDMSLVAMGRENYVLSSVTVVGDRLLWNNGTLVWISCFRHISINY